MEVVVMSRRKEQGEVRCQLGLLEPGVALQLLYGGALLGVYGQTQPQEVETVCNVGDIEESCLTWWMFN